jgi:Family of unknown function (DUF6056)
LQGNAAQSATSIQHASTRERRYAPAVAGDSVAVSGVTRVPLRGRRHVGLCPLVEWVMGAALLAALAAYMLLGNFTRYVADDYGIADAVRLRGYWAQQIAAYRLSDGHFVATALYTAGSLLDPVFVRVLPGVLILAWVALLALALRYLIPAAGRLGRLLIAAGIVYATLQVTPSPFLAAYWMTASLEFVVPLLLAAVFVWLISRPSSRGRGRTLVIALIGMLAFLAAGEAEIFTAAQCAALTLAVAMSPLSWVWRQKLPELRAAWIGSLAGLAIELASPGKALRSTAIAKIVHVPRPSLLTLPFFTFGQMLHFLQTLLQGHWRELVAMALLAALIGVRSGMLPKVGGRPGPIALVLATFGMLVIVFAALAPAALYYGGLPPLWDQIIPVYVCVCGVATLGWLSGGWLRALVDLTWQRAGWSERLRRTSAAGASAILGAVVVIGPIATVVAIDHELPAIQAYAAIKDAQAAGAEAAQAAGETSATVPPLTMVTNLGVFSHPAFEDLMRDPHFWINVDEAKYYGIVSMATSP